MGMLQRDVVQFCFEIVRQEEELNCSGEMHNEPFNGLHYSNLGFFSFP